MSLNGYKIYNVKGDGNCLYRAIIQGYNRIWSKRKLGKVEEDILSSLLKRKVLSAICKSKRYERNIIKELKNNYGLKGGSLFKTYCECQKRGLKCFGINAFKWGGRNEIKEMVKILKCNIIVYVKDGKGYKKHIHTFSKSKQTLNLLLENSHYKYMV